METLTIKTTIQVPTEIHKEIKLPAYYRLGPTHWKIVSEMHAVAAVYSKFGISRLDIQSPDQPFAHSTLEECTEEEFNEAYNSALNAITSLNK